MKQPKINGFFQKKYKADEIPDDCKELIEEIKQLQESLKLKKEKLFHLQRNSYRIGHIELRQESESPTKKDEEFVRPETIVLANSIQKLKAEQDLRTMLTGIEIQSYVMDDHCVIVYHMPHNTLVPVKHGLRIDLRLGTNVITESSLPFGFNLNAVLNDYDNIMVPECIQGVRVALVAYYNRLEQFNALKKMLNIDAQLIRNVDATHVEVMFKARSELEAPGDEILVVVMLDYGVCDEIPSQYSVGEIDIPEPAVVVLKSQCKVFKKYFLIDAFKHAFIDGVGPYLIESQFDQQPEGQQPRRRKRKYPHNNNDDTFRPEDCSQSEDDQDE